MARIAGGTISILDVSDSVSIALSNEADVFEGDTDGVLGTQTTSTQIMAYRANEPVSCFVDGDIECPDGLTIVNDEKVPFPTLTITVTDKIKTAGYIDIPIKVSGDLEYAKRFSWGISKQGQVGKATYWHIKYSPVSHPTAEQMTEIPDKFMGQYIDEFPQDSDDPLKYTWTQWLSNDPVSISGIIKRYGLSDSVNDEPTTWLIDPPTLTVDNRIMWSKEIQELSDGSSIELPAQVAVIYDPPCSLIIESTNGTVIRNSRLQTALFITIIYGNITINDSATMKKYFGQDSYLQWSEKTIGNSLFADIAQNDHRLTNEGFFFTINAEQISKQSIFDCKLIIPDQ